MPSFSGTAYLGLDRHPQMLAWVKEGMEQFGTHYGGSRRSPLAPSIFERAEETLAKWTGAPTALLVGSGTQAGQLVVRFLAQNGFELHYAPDTHPAMAWETEGQGHNSWKSWQGILEIGDSQALKAGLLNAIDPLQVQRPPLSGDIHLKSLVVVDDSHTIGIQGQQGSGSWRDWFKKADNLLVSSSLGKALSLPAGVILGNTDIIAQLRDLPQFGGASPPPPAYLFAWLKARELMMDCQRHLQERIEYFNRHLSAPTLFRKLPRYPVWATDQHELAAFLAKRDIHISHFPYPGPDDPLITRIVLRADHSFEDIDRLLEGVEDFFKQT